jgi:hypothetical protein
VKFQVLDIIPHLKRIALEVIPAVPAAAANHRSSHVYAH